MNGPKRVNVVHAMQAAADAVRQAVHPDDDSDGLPELTATRADVSGFAASFGPDCQVRFMRLPFGPADGVRWYVVAESGLDAVVTPCKPELAADLDQLSGDAR